MAMRAHSHGARGQVHNWISALALSAVAITLADMPRAAAQDAPAALAALLVKAKEEGAVSIFAGTARYPDSAATQLAEAFQAKFGFPLKITLPAPGPHPAVVQQLIAETKAGVKPSMDIFPTALAFFGSMREAGAIEKVDWAALGVPSNVIAPPGDNVQISTIARNVIYNTNLVSKAEAPRRLQDLADPKWKGKIVAPAIPDVFSVMTPVLGEQGTLDLVRKLVNDQQITLIQSVTDVGTKVASGEFALGFGVPADWAGLRKKGAPIDNAPLEKVSGQPFNAAVLAHAPHPATATVFTYFVCCTPEGQKALYQAIGWANFDTPGTEPFEIGGQGRGINPDHEWQIHDQRRVGQAIAKILGQ
jgi:ABC-type Fe3+ transport system substrate-binding protein